MPSNDWLTDKFLAVHYHVSRKTIWRWAAEGRLPAPVRIGPATTRWRKSDIEEHDRRLELATRAATTAQAAP